MTIQFQNSRVILPKGSDKMVGKDTTVISLALPKELNAKAEKKAKELNISRNAYMRIAISKMLKEEK